MILLNLNIICCVVLASLAAIICSVSFAELGWDRSIKTIPQSYYNVSTPNVARCGKLCERQGKCVAVTFHVIKKKCYMHDTPVNTNQTEGGSNGQYLIKNYPMGTKPDAVLNTCDRETQISVPTKHNKYGGCYDIIDGRTVGTQVTTTDPLSTPSGLSDMSTTVATMSATTTTTTNPTTSQETTSMTTEPTSTTETTAAATTTTKDPTTTMGTTAETTETSTKPATTTETTAAETTTAEPTTTTETTATTSTTKEPTTTMGTTAETSETSTKPATTTETTAAETTTAEPTTTTETTATTATTKEPTTTMGTTAETTETSTKPATTTETTAAATTTAEPTTTTETTAATKETTANLAASCPTDRGYQLWTYSDMQLCIKYISGVGWSKNYQEMQNRCDEDGAHIAMIENDSMRLHIVDIDSQVNPISEDYTFLDGKDTRGTGEFTNWKNEATWLSWAPGYPSGGNCLFSRREGWNFYHGNYNCDQDFQYVLCQFDG